MIETVHFQNFKALRALTLELERLTVLVGPNASGKTSVLQGLAYLHFCKFAGKGFFRGDRSPHELRSRKAKGSTVLGCSGTQRQKTSLIELSFDELAPGEDSFAWSARITHGTTSVELDEIHLPEPPSEEASDVLNQAMPAVAMLRLEANKIAQTSYSGALVPRVEPDGEGAAAVLADMLVSRAEDFQKIEEALKAVIPSVERIRLERAPVRRSELQQITINGQTMAHSVEREYVGYRIVFDMRGAPSLPAHAASEGTLITLGILTAVMAEKGPHLVLIDDLERAIHPRALADLVAQLRKLLELFPELQIVATSHSPYLIDHLHPKEVWLMMTSEDGSALCARLDEHPEFERWIEVMQPGEMWSMVGESWVREKAARQHG
jgi:AAA domain, putative AbiEii toxin, Type IV TA system